MELGPSFLPSFFFLLTRTPVPKIIVLYLALCAHNTKTYTQFFVLVLYFLGLYVNQALLPPCVDLPFKTSSCSEASWACPLHRLDIPRVHEDELRSLHRGSFKLR